MRYSVKLVLNLELLFLERMDHVLVRKRSIFFFFDAMFEFFMAVAQRF